MVRDGGGPWQSWLAAVASRNAIMSGKGHELPYCLCSSTHDCGLERCLSSVNQDSDTLPRSLLWELKPPGTGYHENQMS